MNGTCEIRDCPDTGPAVAINGHYFCLKHFRGAIAYLGFGAPEVVEPLINRLQKTNKEKITHG